MKTLPLLLALSLVANAALLVLRPHLAPADAQAIPSGASASPPPSSPHPAHPSSLRGPIPVAEIWAALNPGDLTDYVANLRAAGFPDEIVRSLASHEIYTRHRTELEALQEPPVKLPPYWEPQNHNPGNSPERRERQETRNRIYAGINEELTALVGPNPHQIQSQNNAFYERQYGPFPAEKITALQKIQRDYQDLMSGIHRESQGLFLASDRATLDFLKNEQEADIAALLSPEELRQWQLRSSSTANALRNEFQNLTLTEAQYQTLFDLRKPFDETYGDRPNGGSIAREQMNERQAAEKALRESYRTVLGEDAYAAYQLQQNNDYRMAKRITDRLALPETTARQVFELKATTEAAINTVRRDKTLSADQRNTELGRLYQETSRTVEAALGAEGTELYLNNGGWWLKNLAPKNGG